MEIKSDLAQFIAHPIMILLYFVIILAAAFFIGYFIKPSKPDKLRQKMDKELDWDYWLQLAYSTLNGFILNLPNDLKVLVSKNSIELKRWESITDEDSIFGTYIINDGVNPIITINIGEILTITGMNEAIFKEEVVKTFYHEFGHYLGLNEYDLEKRNLD